MEDCFKPYSLLYNNFLSLPGNDGIVSAQKK
jgi:hypothetical protein